MTRSEIKQLLRAALQERLSADLGPEDEDKSFLQLGLDSVIATELIELIRQEIDPMVGVAALFDYPSVNELSLHLASGNGASFRTPDLVKADAIDEDSISSSGTANLQTQSVGPQVRNSNQRPVPRAYPPIAVIGLSGRFPGAANAEQLWQNLVQGVCSVTEIPPDRSRYWDLGGLAQVAESICRLGGFLADVESFDPLFFGISPSEAAMTDPQQRLLLEEAWKAVEDAGYAVETLSDTRCGVFAGLLNTDYHDLLTQVNALKPKPHELMGTAASILAGRIAYHLNLNGPAIAVDTACSASLVAVHLACRALQLHEVDVALAGGVTLYLTQRRYHLMEYAGMLSPSGKCSPFDDSADGTVPGEAVGVVVLKRLDDAVAAGDPIHGVIATSGFNQAGKTGGITVPSTRSQLELFKEMNWRGGIDPGSLDYIETHGTGTKLGDPIEFEAINLLFQDARRESPCLLGSLKANIGHTTAAAGIAGLIKLLLALKYKKIPPQIHFEVPNRHTDFGSSPLRVNTELVPWLNHENRPRRGALNAFGFSGTNAYLVVEEAPEMACNRPVATAPGPFWIILSARTIEALRVKASELDAWLKDSDRSVALVDLSYTLAVGRSAFEERFAFQANSLSDVSAGLNQFLRGPTDRSLWSGRILSSPPAEESFSCLGEAWVFGAKIDWLNQYAGFNPVRLHLPVYPFARERCWYDLLDTAETVSTPSVERSSAGMDQHPFENSRFEPGIGGRTPVSRTVRLKKLEEIPLPGANEELSRSCDREVSPGTPDKAGYAASLPTGTEPAAGSSFEGLQHDDNARLRRTRALDSGPPVEDARRSPDRNCPDCSSKTRELAHVREQLRRLVAATLYLKEVQIQDDKKFAELGLDSILAVELVKKVNAELGLNLSSATLYSYPTIRQLAAFTNELEGEGGAAVAEAFHTKFAPDPRPENSNAGVLLKRTLVQRSGDIADLEMVNDRIEPPGPDEVQIAVEAASVMLADLLCVRGLYPTMPAYPFTPGFEIAGTVVAVGKQVSMYAPGDRVYGMSGAGLGGQAQRINVESRLICRIPDGLDAAEACSLPVSFFSAYHALFNVGKLGAGESVLIHSAASCTGLMAIQLAVRAGAQVSATVGRENKITYLRELGLRSVFNYQSPELFDEIDALQPHKRFDIILNLLAGDIRDQSLTLLAPGGRFLDLAVGGLKMSPVPAHLSDNQAYFGIDCRRISLQQPDYVSDSLTHLNDLLSRGEVRPLPIGGRFLLSDIRAAYVALESRQLIGRLIVSPQEKQLSPARDQMEAPSNRVTISEPLKNEPDARRQKGLSKPVSPSFEPIAIIGMSGRFPGARNLDQFWQNLVAAKCSIANAAVRFPVLPANLKPDHFWGGFLEGFDEFDAAFFQMAPAEAETMDPQHRLFLQVAWHALEDGGYAPESLVGKAGGIFVGIGPSEYYSELEELNAHSLIANLGSGLAGRLAYLLDWTGPSLAVDTACSSSMSAIHLACVSLARRECEFALAGGVHVMTSPKTLTANGLMGLLSSSGSCRTFDAAADGWVIAEGVGAILLKRLDDAIRDRDHIHGVIRGSGMQQDGTKNGPAAPKASSQTALQIRVYEQSGINPETIDHVEAHGLSIRLGDEIELLALRDAFCHFTQRKGFCGIGSVKPNIGHALAASGMASLFKVLLALRAGKRPPQPQVQHVNENLGFDSGPFFLPDGLEDWPRRGGNPRRAAINGLSATGTNCHLVVEEDLPPESTTQRRRVSPRRPALLVISARDSVRLSEAATNLLGFLERGAEVHLIDLAYTLQTGRKAMEQRLAWTAVSVDEAREKLSSFINRGTRDGFYRGNAESSDGTMSLLVSGPEGRQFLAAAYENNALDKLARLWVGGIDIDWGLLYEGLQPRRVPLPVYPFARTRYWRGQPVRSTAPGSSEINQSPQPGSKAGHNKSLEADVALDPDQITDLLRKIISATLNCPDSELDADRDLRRYGFDSLYVLGVLEKLEEVLGVRVPARIFFECTTLGELGSRVAEILSAGGENQGPEPKSPIPNGEFSLSEGQKALWAIQKADPGDTAYHTPFAFYWDGPLNLTMLEKAWSQTVERHPALHTVFPFGLGGPVQKIVRPHSARASSEHLSNLEEAQIVERILESARQPFDLENGPLWRLHIFSISGGRNIVLIALHHLIFDGHSLGLVWQELLRRYQALENGTQTPSAETSPSYFDFVRAEQEYLRSERSQEDENYWVAEFPAGFSRLGLPEHSNGPVAHGEILHAVLPKSLVTTVRQVSETERVTVQSVFLSAFIALIGEASGKLDVVTGIAADARPSTGFQEVVGFLANVLPLSVKIDRDEPFRVFLHRVFDRLVGAIEHRRFPFSRLVQLLNQRTGARNELEIAFYFQSWRSKERAAIADKLVPGVQQSGEFKLVFEVIEGLGDWYLNIKYRPGVFVPEKIRDLARGFQWLLELIVEDANRVVGCLSTPHDPAANRSAFNYPYDRCVHELIAEQARQTPGKVAIRFGDQQISYRDFDLQSGRLSERLIEAGVRPGCLVGVLVDRSIEMVTTLVAIWKAGAAYVPLDPNHPRDRTDYILRDARVNLVVTRRSDAWRSAEIPVLDLDQTVLEARPLALWQRRPELNSGTRAYVIYTSGSTGNPKGVQISHRSLTHFLCCMAQRPGCCSNDYILAATTICFDIAALELFLPLITGGCVEVLPDTICKNGVRFRQKIESSPATLIQGTPATWRMLLAAGLGGIPRVKALCGGEAWDRALAEQLLERAAEVWNMYGPTETTVWSSIQKVERGQPICLGEPIGNTEFYIFDESMRSVRLGETGELYIGGDGLAIGYLNRPDLTSERFVPHPSRPTELIYRTGDLVRYV
jgi:amino acid adenylation domain-containing protein